MLIRKWGTIANYKDNQNLKEEQRWDRECIDQYSSYIKLKGDIFMKKEFITKGLNAVDCIKCSPIRHKQGSPSPESLKCSHSGYTYALFLELDSSRSNLAT